MDQSSLPRPDARPLYVQVEEILTRRIAGGQWRPGEALPAEPEIAQELGVSQGTLRKALAGMEQRGLITRQQGRGTFVTAQTSERSRYHYFRVFSRDGTRPTPLSVVRSLDLSVVPTADEAAALRLPPASRVHRVERVRMLEGRARMLEHIVLPAGRFPGFALPPGEMRAELYVLFQQRHGVFVARAEERLAATAASAHAAAALGVTAGSPLLSIERIAFDIGGEPVEYRATVLDTAQYRYLTELD